MVAFAALRSFIISLKPHLFSRLTAYIIIFYMGHEKHKEVALLRRVCVQVCIVCVRVCVSMCMMRFKLYVHNALGMHGKVKS